MYSQHEIPITTKDGKQTKYFFPKEHTHNTKDERTISKGLGQLGLAWYR